MMKRQRNDVGFTLVELLVVITIIGILMGLLIPAVNAAREAARRNHCSTQIKNLSLAAIQHENSEGELPGWVQEFGSFQGGSDPSNTGVSRHVKIGTWAVALLPWLDTKPTYEHWTEDRYPVISDGNGEYGQASGDSGDGLHPVAAPNLAIMQCPSNPVSRGDHGKNSYVSNNGTLVTVNPATQIRFDQCQNRANGAFNNKYEGPTHTNWPCGPRVRLDDLALRRPKAR